MLEKRPDFKEYIQLFRALLTVMKHTQMDKFYHYLERKLEISKFKTSLQKLNQTLDNCLTLTGLGPFYNRAMKDLKRDFKFEEWLRADLVEGQESKAFGGVKL